MTTNRLFLKLVPGNLARVVRMDEQDPAEAIVFSHFHRWNPENALGGLKEDEEVVFLEFEVPTGDHASAKVLTRYGIGWMNPTRLVPVR